MNRPKWAKNIDRKTWKHLQEAQWNSKPTLKQLKLDVEHQNNICLPCVMCSHALNLVNNIKEN